MREMSALIRESLVQLEQDEGIVILYACEAGSRAWGFPSRDSDYDVRFLYVRPVDWYLSIFAGRDVIERPVDFGLDMVGWDLKKGLNLFRKSNPPLLEWLDSPIRYRERTSAAGRIRKLSPLNFSPKSCTYHYLNMAKGNYRDYLQRDEVKVKKYFYVLRPILACEWIERFGSMPPLSFDMLAESLIPAGSELHDAVLDLIRRKKSGEDLGHGPRMRLLNDYLERQIAYYEESASRMPAGRDNVVQDDELDLLFRAVLKEAWGKEGLLE
ncbi:nucleotidyltransferase domain-containing protein [Paenibacillus sp. DMB20]|uniref:nucleotidyltransferase domain-containing protein n=1 Tax=Paenibacillus sp. DMB20 TaxID=1642570 RepID=UPI0006282932|nr:nucleotidyltransferase domain-containing protein [Paenibacillus sp. DMB20]KKO54224.1 hypothetical protein XI25_09255 [Paenibacillus sp. DMB20]